MELTIVEEIIASEGRMSVAKYREVKPLYEHPDGTTQENLAQLFTRTYNEFMEAQADEEWDKATLIEQEMLVIHYMQKEFEYGLRK